MMQWVFKREGHSDRNGRNAESIRNGIQKRNPISGPIKCTIFIWYLTERMSRQNQQVMTFVIVWRQGGSEKHTFLYLQMHVVYLNGRNG